MNNPPPSGWTITTIGSVCQLINGRAFKPTDWKPEGLPIIRIQNLNNLEAPFNKYPGDFDPKHLVRDGDLLFAWSGTPGTSFGAHVWTRGKAILNQHIFRVIHDKKRIDRDFFKLAINFVLEELIFKAHGGAGLAHITKGRFEETGILLPPLPEQRRIVARIEALYARTRRARADLERIAPLSKRYIEQCRRRAFDEDATWPTAPIDRQFPDYTPPRRFDELRDLPQGWLWADMSTLGDIVGGITKNQKRANQPLQMPYLRVANVYADELRLDEVTTIQVTFAELERVRLRRGDLLIVEGNGSVEQIGRVAVWNGSIENCGHQNHLIRVRPIDGVPSRFLLHWLMSPYGRSILETVASSSSGLHTLSLSKIGAVPVPVAPVFVADVVVASLDRRLESAKAMQADTTRALALLDRLEQSILARAFRGELVAQETEPTAVRVFDTTPASRIAQRPRRSGRAAA